MRHVIDEGRNRAEREALADRIELERLGVHSTDVDVLLVERFARAAKALRELVDRLDALDAKRSR